MIQNKTKMMAEAFEWRLMQPEDMDRVYAVSLHVHPDFHERKEIFEERLKLYPQGCLVLLREDTIIGYFLSHPWWEGEAPPLDTLLGKLPVGTQSYYFHDLALLPAARGSGSGRIGVDILCQHAHSCGFSEIGLVAVNGSEKFWNKMHFQALEYDEKPAKLTPYGDDAVFMTRVIRE